MAASTTTTVFKIVCGDEIRRTELAEPVTRAALASAALDMFPMARLNCGDVALSWVDEDADNISLRTDEDVAQAQKAQAASGASATRVIVTGKTAAAAPTAAATGRVARLQLRRTATAPRPKAKATAGYNWRQHIVRAGPAVDRQPARRGMMMRHSPPPADASASASAAASPTVAPTATNARMTVTMLDSASGAPLAEQPVATWGAVAPASADNNGPVARPKGGAFGRRCRMAAAASAAASASASAQQQQPRQPARLRARLVEDVTVPAGTSMTPGATFTKTWRFRNESKQAWPAGTVLAFVPRRGSHPMGSTQRSIALPAEAGAPNDSTTDISVDLVAPTEPGAFAGFWRLTRPDGTKFGQRAAVHITVPASDASTTDDSDDASASTASAAASASDGDDDSTSSSVSSSDDTDEDTPSTTASTTVADRRAARIAKRQARRAQRDARREHKQQRGRRVAAAGNGKHIRFRQQQAAEQPRGDWAQKLSELRAMGFDNDRLSIRLLRQSGGDLDIVVTRLLNQAQRRAAAAATQQQQ